MKELEHAQHSEQTQDAHGREVGGVLGREGDGHDQQIEQRPAVVYKVRPAVCVSVYVKRDLSYAKRDLSYAKRDLVRPAVCVSVKRVLVYDPCCVPKEAY